MGNGTEPAGAYEGNEAGGCKGEKVREQNEFTKFIPRRSIGLRDPKTTGRVVECYKCGTVFRAQAGDECPFCGAATRIERKRRAH